MGDGGVDVEPYNYAPYMGLSTQSIGQIPHHSPISPSLETRPLPPQRLVLSG